MNPYFAQERKSIFSLVNKGARKRTLFPEKGPAPQNLPGLSNSSALSQHSENKKRGKAAASPLFCICAVRQL